MSDGYEEYVSLKYALESGRARRLSDLLDLVPVVPFSNDMNLSYNTLCKRLLDTNQLTVSNIIRLGFITGIVHLEIFRFIIKERSAQSETKINGLDGLNNKYGVGK